MSIQESNDQKQSLSTKEVLDKIQSRLNNPIVKALLGETKRPNKTRLSSNYPYYRERFALQFKSVLDEMIAEYENGILEDRVYRYAEFPDFKPVTLYLKINQSRAYLLDNMDAEHRYAAFSELISITRNSQDKGIRIGYNQDLINPSASSFKPSIVEIKSRSNEWKEKLDSFLMNNNNVGEELAINKIALSDEDVAVVTASLEQLTNVTYKVDNRSIWVAKF